MMMSHDRFIIEGPRAKRAYIAFLANFHFFAGSS